MKKLFFFAALFAAVLVSAGTRSAVIATYNIHHGKNIKRKLDLSGTAAALRMLNAETIILNEVDFNTKRSGKVDQAAFLAKELKMNHVFGRSIDLQGGHYGNAVLSVYKVEKIDLLKIPSRGEARSALVVKIHAPTPYYVIATHFVNGEVDPEIEALRVKCIDLIADYIDAKKYSPVIFGGDLNSRHHGAVVSRMQQRKFKILNDLSGKMLSFPSWKPNRLLDYLTIYPADSADGKTARIFNTLASDHLPVAAEIIFSDPR